MRRVRSKLAYYAPRLSMTAASVYVSLTLSEIVLWRMEPKQYLRDMSRGLYSVKGDEIVLNPGYTGHFDDGYAHGDIRVNSLGYRGHEPRPDSTQRVLLVGDSFTFGAFLDQSETIDACMERLDPGLEVVNLGVSGYNLPQQLEPLREWALTANRVVYLFYENDLDGTTEQDVVDGYRVRRLRHPDGRLMSHDELRPVVSEFVQQMEQSRAFGFRSVLLPRVHQLFGSLRTKLTTSESTMSRSLYAADHDGMVSKALEYTREMYAIAAGRGMEFQVAIVPSAEEAKLQKYFPMIAQYVAGLQSTGISVIELLPRLSADDYWTHDPHFNPEGARVAADIIYHARKH